MQWKNSSMMTFCIIMSVLYVISTQFFDFNYVSTVVATVVAGFGIFGVWIQLKKETDIKEAEFLMNFNFTFITTEKFVRMEKRLEHARKSGEPMTFTDEERQELIDYLVYLESFAPLVLKKMVRLEVIDDLFGYRFFIAVNNKDVQELELCPEAQYYRGCFKLYQEWKAYRLENNLDIPMDETGLDKWADFGRYI